MGTLNEYLAEKRLALAARQERLEAGEAKPRALPHTAQEHLAKQKLDKE